MVVTPDAVKGCPLTGVQKSEPPRSKFARLWHTRLGKHAMSLDTLQQIAGMRARGGRAPGWLSKSIGEFQPEAVLTVGIAGAWIHAAGLARHLRIPLHMIVHDDGHYAYFWLPILQPYGERLFGRAYRQSASRLCISAPMEREYERRFGVPGEVLLPSRGRDSIFFGEPPPRVVAPLENAKIFYAGSIYGQGFEALDEIAVALRAKGHRLIVYSPSTPATLRPRALELRAPLPSADLVRTLHKEADILLLLTSFAPENREVVSTLFPSKMVDYTGAAVPVLVAAPEYACIVDYLRRRPHAGHLVTSDRGADVLAAVEELVADASKRQALARGAVAAGLKNFSYDNAWEQFVGAMRRKRLRRCGG